jgi:predicted nuclease with TOPRIM domain
MREQLTQRLDTLRKEFELGQTKLQELERQQAALSQTLLRISGAIQVLEELLAEPEPTQQQPHGNA